MREDCLIWARLFRKKRSIAQPQGKRRQRHADNGSDSLGKGLAQAMCRRYSHGLPRPPAAEQEPLRDSLDAALLIVCAPGLRPFRLHDRKGFCMRLRQWARAGRSSSCACGQSFFCGREVCGPGECACAYARRSWLRAVVSLMHCLQETFAGKFSGRALPTARCLEPNAAPLSTRPLFCAFAHPLREQNGLQWGQMIGTARHITARQGPRFVHRLTGGPEQFHCAKALTPRSAQPGRCGSGLTCGSPRPMRFALFPHGSSRGW